MRFFWTTERWIATSTVSGLALLSLLLLVACNGSSSSAVTIPDVRLYLDALRCSDGMPSVIESCAEPRPQRGSDPLKARRLDRSRPTASDGQVEDVWRSDDGSYWVNSYSYPPHGPRSEHDYNGGDVMVTDGTTVRFSFTRPQNSANGITEGWWTGPGCGGDGWVLFRNTAPTGSWEGMVARLGASVAAPSDCSSGLSSAYTRWRLEKAAVSFLVNSTSMTATGQIIVSEHYGGTSIASADAFERVILLAGYGRVEWQHFTAAKPVGSVPTGCPSLSPWTDTPAGFYLADERCPTDVEAADGSQSGDSYGWPPAGAGR